MSVIGAQRSTVSVKEGDKSGKLQRTHFTAVKTAGEINAIY